MTTRPLTRNIIRPVSWPPSGRRFTQDISKIIPSALFDVDATLAASYDGGEILRNMVPTPADGSDRSAYHFSRGASVSVGADDPAFVGGVGSPSAYFTNNGSQLFRLLSGANTTFLNNLHKSTGGVPFTMILAGTVADHASSRIWMGTSITANGVGMKLNITSTESISQIQSDGSSSETLGSGVSLTIGTPFLAVFSFDGSVPRRAVNSRTFTVGAAETLLTTTANASSPMVLFRLADSGSWFKSAAMLPFALSSNIELGMIYDMYNSRHQHLYA